MLASIGNALYSFYVFQPTPVGPIWFLHLFYVVATLLMLVWHVQTETPYPNPGPSDARWQTRSFATGSATTGHVASAGVRLRHQHRRTRARADFDRVDVAVFSRAATADCPTALNGLGPLTLVALGALLA